MKKNIFANLFTTPYICTKFFANISFSEQIFVENENFSFYIKDQRNFQTNFPKKLGIIISFASKGKQTFENICSKIQYESWKSLLKLLACITQLGCYTGLPWYVREAFDYGRGRLIEKKEIHLSCRWLIPSCGYLLTRLINFLCPW